MNNYDDNFGVGYMVGLTRAHLGQYVYLGMVGLEVMVQRISPGTLEH